jgi:hypothetical protein
MNATEEGAGGEGEEADERQPSGECATEVSPSLGGRLTDGLGGIEIRAPTWLIHRSSTSGFVSVLQPGQTTKVH